MTIRESDGIEQPMDIGIEEECPASAEMSNNLPHNVISSEDIEDAFDFLSESHIAAVDTMQEKTETHEQEDSDWEDTERLPSERIDNTMAAYLRDIGRVSLLTHDEEY